MVNFPVSRKADLRGRTALVTGAAGGIGRAVALTLAREGAAIAALDVLNPADTVEAVVAAGGRAIGLSTDVRDADQVRAAVEQTATSLGGPHLLVTCAGIYGRDRSIDVSPDEWDLILDVNLKGTWLFIQAVFPKMEAIGGGKIICIGSVGGKAGGMVSGAPYIASKGAVHSLVKWAALRGAQHGIYCNAIAPGVVDTPMIDGQPYMPDYNALKRFAEPPDIAEVVAFLSSDAANYVDGVVWDVDGGYRFD